MEQRVRRIYSIQDSVIVINLPLSDFSIRFFLLKLPKAVSSPCFTANKYNLDVKLDKQNKLDLKNSNMWHVVRAISEDYYTGDLTKSQYESKSKERI